MQRHHVRSARSSASSQWEVISPGIRRDELTQVAGQYQAGVWECRIDFRSAASRFESWWVR